MHISDLFRMIIIVLQHDLHLFIQHFLDISFLVHQIDDDHILMFINHLLQMSIETHSCHFWEPFYFYSLVSDSSLFPE